MSFIQTVVASREGSRNFIPIRTGAKSQVRTSLLPNHEVQRNNVGTLELPFSGNIIPWKGQGSCHEMHIAAEELKFSIWMNMAFSTVDSSTLGKPHLAAK
jgi:hypothetical protein